jgi:hypothetical protein
MSRLGRVAAAGGRGAAWRVRGGRRDWAEAVWAEAYEVPAGLGRLAWRAGAVRMIAREAMMARRIASSLLFAVAAAYVAWATWPGSAGSFATVTARIDVVAIVLLLAGLPWLVRRFLGPASGGHLGRLLRVGAYAAVLALTVAHARVLRVAGAPADGPARQFAWFTEYFFLAVIAVYVAGILAVTSRRSRIAPATLAIGTGAGIAFGLVMYAVMPIGFGKDATEPWLAGSAIDPVVALAWILLLGGPMVAGGLAGRLYRGSESDSADQLMYARVRQGAAAGFLATGVGALIVTVLGAGTIALMPRAAWLQHWLYPGQHLLATVAYGRDFSASSHTQGYGLMLLLFPVIGLLFGTILGPSASSYGPAPGGGGPPDPPGPEPAPDPPDGGRRADADLSARLAVPSEGGLGPRQVSGKRVPGGPVQVPGELDRTASLVIGNAFHGQQGRAAGLVQCAGFGARGVLRAHPLGGGVQPDTGGAQQLVQAVLLEHLDAQLDQPGRQVVVHQGHRLAVGQPDPLK